MEENGTILTNQKYQMQVKRTRISNDQKEEVKKILNDILPVQSGRNWRYQEVTNDTLYEQYIADIGNGKAVSKYFFIYKVLAKENIHHSKKVKFCPICEQNENGDQSINVLKHMELTPIQRQAYQRDKKEIASEDAFKKYINNSGLYSTGT